MPLNATRLKALYTYVACFFCCCRFDEWCECVVIFVKVFDGKGKTYDFRKELREAGFSFSSFPEPHWSSEVPKEDFNILKKWCFKKKLRVVCSMNERSADYRRMFFESGRTKAFKNKYFCAYCGKVLSEDKVCVDHLISVKKTQTVLFYFNLIDKLGFDSVNDVRNLVPACRRCNARKGAKGRLWVLRGLIGQFPVFWAVFRGVEIILAFCFFVLLLYFSF